MKVKISVLILILFCVILNAQSLYNTKLYGFNGIVKTVTSYEYENQDLKKENYKSKTMLYFNTSGELTKSIRDIKSSDRIYTFKSTFISAKNKVFQLRYDYDSKLSDSITYEKINKNLYSIHGKEIETNIKTIGKQFIDDFGRDLSSNYEYYDGSKIIEKYSYRNILENNLVTKYINNFDGKLVTENLKYYEFDENKNPTKILFFELDDKSTKKIIIREFTYY